ncbi:MAG: hypothetical protein NZ562_05785 [Thermomicrobium sp.]|nr:hypothetical protein [Thermomicrobium sp.]MDW8059325.1 hypothetical protein [Thermomicrobium sp.]
MADCRRVLRADAADAIVTGRADEFPGALTVWPAIEFPMVVDRRDVDRAVEGIHLVRRVLPTMLIGDEPSLAAGAREPAGRPGIPVVRDGTIVALGTALVPSVEGRPSARGTADPTGLDRVALVRLLLPSFKSLRSLPR